MKIIYLFLFILFLTSCKNDQLENAIMGTYYNNNYKLVIEIGSGQFGSISGEIRERSYKRAILYKWEEEHENFLIIGSEIQGPDYYEIHSGQWAIEDGNLKLTFYNEDKFQDMNFKVIPINFNSSAAKDWHNMNSSFILRGSEQNFFPALVSQGYHSE
jgi:hypothetical protein